MVIDLGIQVRSEDLDYVRRELAAMPLKMPKVIAGALNDSIGTAQSFIARKLKSVSRIKKKDRLIKDIRPVKATYTKLAAGVSFYGRAIGAIQFQHTVFKTKGVRWKVDKGGQFLKHSGGFKGIGIGGQRADAPGNEHLWIREGAGKHRVGVKAPAHHKPNEGRMMQRIRPNYGPKIGTLFTRYPEIKIEAQKLVALRLNSRILSQVDRALNRKKANRPLDVPVLVMFDASEGGESNEVD